jgi:hypothetical protein
MHGNDISNDDDTIALVAEVRKIHGLIHNLPPKNETSFSTPDGDAELVLCNDISTHS